MNSTKTMIKTTKIQRMINTQITILFIILLLISIFGAIGQSIADNSDFNKNIVMNTTNNRFTEFLKNILTYIILFNNLIPLSLLVTLEFTRLVIGRLISLDLDLYYSESDEGAKTQSSGLVEELGQIDYIFTDKTGTLTRNIMEFKMACINGISYGENVLGKQHVFILIGV